MNKLSVVVVVGILVLLCLAAWACRDQKHPQVVAYVWKDQELQIAPLPETIVAILDRIAAVSATGAIPPDDLIRKLEDRWRNERPKDIGGLEALLRSLRAKHDDEKLQMAKTSAEEFRATSAGKVSKFRRRMVKEPSEPKAVVGEKEPGWIYPVFFGTNRTPLGTHPKITGFGSARARFVSYGRYDVWIPATHRFGETGTPWWRRWLRLQFDDDHLRVHKRSFFGQTEFWCVLRSEMEKATDEQPHALVYLHGYNVTFQDAAIRAAQMGFDLKVNGATAFFSWPSQGTLRGYLADTASIEASEDAIAHFLADFVRQSGAKVVHLVAHSMGNRGLLRSLQRLAADAQLQLGVRFGQIFLAAPDVDRDLFLSLAKLYPQFSARTTLYASDADRALATSAWIHFGDRAGYCPPVTVPGLVRFDTIRVPDLDLDLLGHSYYAEAEAMLYDISELMKHDTPPKKRSRLQVVDNYWELRR